MFLYSGFLLHWPLLFRETKSRSKRSLDSGSGNKKPQPRQQCSECFFSLSLSFSLSRSENPETFNLRKHLSHQSLQASSANHSLRKGGVACACDSLRKGGVVWPSVRLAIIKNIYFFIQIYCILTSSEQNRNNNMKQQAHKKWKAGLNVFLNSQLVNLFMCVQMWTAPV